MRKLAENEKTLSVLLTTALAVVAYAQPVAATKAQTPNPELRNVLELMVTKSGDRVTDVVTWEKARRPELLDIFRLSMFAEKGRDLPCVDSKVFTAPVKGENSVTRDSGVSPCTGRRGCGIIAVTLKKGDK